MNKPRLYSVLAMIEDEDLSRDFEFALNDTVWKLESAAGLPHAVAKLRQSPIGLVVADKKHWQSMLKATQQLSPVPRVIVVDRAADDELWLDVLQFGAFDLLSQPFDRREIHRVLMLGWLSWCDHWNCATIESHVNHEIEPWSRPGALNWAGMV